MSLIEWLIATAIFAILFVIGVAMWNEATADTMELRKNEWTCTRTEEYTYTSYVMIGKVMVPQYYTDRRCAAWERLP